MLFWIFVILLVLGIISSIVYVHTNKYDYEWLCVSSAICTSCATFAILICFIFFGLEYVGLKGQISAYHHRYESLVYQYENDFYNNDNDVGKKELMDDIQDWNEDIARWQDLQNDFWVGIFYADIYDQFEFICLEKGTN